MSTLTHLGGDGVYHDLRPKISIYVLCVVVRCIGGSPGCTLFVYVFVVYRYVFWPVHNTQTHTTCTQRIIIDYNL